MISDIPSEARGQHIVEFFGGLKLDEHVGIFFFEGRDRSFVHAYVRFVTTEGLALGLMRDKEPLKMSSSRQSASAGRGTLLSLRRAGVEEAFWACALGLRAVPGKRFQEVVREARALDDATASVGSLDEREKLIRRWVGASSRRATICNELSLQSSAGADEDVYSLLLCLSRNDSLYAAHSDDFDMDVYSDEKDDNVGDSDDSESTVDTTSSETSGAALPSSSSYRFCILLKEIELQTSLWFAARAHSSGLNLLTMKTSSPPLSVAIQLDITSRRISALKKILGIEWRLTTRKYVR